MYVWLQSRWRRCACCVTAGSVAAVTCACTWSTCTRPANGCRVWSVTRPSRTSGTSASTTSTRTMRPSSPDYAPTCISASSKCLFTYILRFFVNFRVVLTVVIAVVLVLIVACLKYRLTSDLCCDQHDLLLCSMTSGDVFI